MHLRLLIIINTNQQNIPCIRCNGSRVMLSFNLIQCRFRILVPFQFYYKRRKIVSVLRLWQKDKIGKTAPGRKFTNGFEVILYGT